MTRFASTKSVVNNLQLTTISSRFNAVDHHYVCCSAVMMIVCVLCSSSLALAADLLRYRNGIRNSNGMNRLKPEQLSKLLESLRQKTGFLEMHFDENEFLHLGDRMKISGGSALARELLIAAVDRAQAIDLECHDKSDKVAFARLAKPINFSNRTTGSKISVYPIEIDFNDFNYLRGDKAAIEAFDLGFVVLHELGHAALGLSDALINGQEPGECEEYINSIRRELGFPERRSYIARTFTSRNFPSQSLLRNAELLFTRSSDQTGKAKNQVLNLSWEAERVGAVRQTEYIPQTILPRSQSASAP